MVIAGIDYSLTGPAICVFSGTGTFSFSKCSFYYLTDTKKYANSYLSNIIGETFLDWDCDIERYETIADWAMEVLMGCSSIALEGYAYGAKGKVFHIAENTGVLKYKIYQRGIPLTIIPPTEVKKYATGKGNSDKEKMYDAFVEENNMLLKSIITPDKKDITSPVSDIVDSYYICKYLYDKLITSS